MHGSVRKFGSMRSIPKHSIQYAESLPPAGATVCALHTLDFHYHHHFIPALPLLLFLLLIRSSIFITSVLPLPFPLTPCPAHASPNGNLRLFDALPALRVLLIPDGPAATELVNLGFIKLTLATTAAAAIRITASIAAVAAAVVTVGYQSDPKVVSNPVQPVHQPPDSSSILREEHHPLHRKSSTTTEGTHD